VRTESTHYELDSLVLSTCFDAMTGALLRIVIRGHADAHCARHGREDRATAEAQEAWVEHGNEVGNATLFPLARSWYTGANAPGKPCVFMPYAGGV
jgi:hypothetical protein